MLLYRFFLLVFRFLYLKGLFPAIYLVLAPKFNSHCFEEQTFFSLNIELPTLNSPPGYGQKKTTRRLVVLDLPNGERDD